MPLHAAKVSKSPRLQRVLDYLKWMAQPSGFGWATTRAIIDRANVCAVNSCVAELRANGYDIECKRDGGVWWYRLREDGE